MQEMIDLRAELDRLIKGLSGVIASRTVLNDDDEIVEVHVLSDMDKSPKQLVRDIQSAVMASMGVDIDYKLISVAQVNSKMVTPDSGEKARLVIRKITISLDSSHLETTVILGQGERTFEGSFKGPLSGRNRIHSAANACLNAIKKYLGAAYSVNLVELKKVPMAGAECYAVAISLAEPFGDHTVYGIAPIGSPETEVQTVVMAVLSAVNRPITRPGKDS